MNLPTLNMIGWSILDYELALDGIRQINDASLWLQNQPRSFNSAKQEYHPGADFVCQVGEIWCSEITSEIIDSLRAIRFPDAEDDERRVRLLVHDATRYGPSGDPMHEVLRIIVDGLAGQAARSAA